MTGIPSGTKAWENPLAQACSVPMGLGSGLFPVALSSTTLREDLPFRFPLIHLIEAGPRGALARVPTQGAQKRRTGRAAGPNDGGAVKILVF